jgi:hypothetical protein
MSNTATQTMANGVTSSDLINIKGTTSAIQTQLNEKADIVGTGHTGEVIIAAVSGDNQASGVTIANSVTNDNTKLPLSSAVYTQVQTLQADIDTKADLVASGNAGQFLISNSNGDMQLSGLSATSFNGANELIQANGTGQLPAIDGSLLTDLNASEVLTGTLPDSVQGANVTLAGNTFNGANQLVKTNGSTQLPAIDGSLLINMNKTQVGLGNVQNVDTTDGANVVSSAFSATNTAITNGNSVNTIGSRAQGQINALLSDISDINADLTTKADKVSGAVANDIAILNSSGNLVDSAVSISTNSGANDNVTVLTSAATTSKLNVNLANYIQKAPLATVGTISTYVSGGSLDTSNKVFSTDGTLAADSDNNISTQKAVKTYVDTGLALKISSSLIGAVSGVCPLDSGTKVPVQYLPSGAALVYQGTWNAATNTPTLANGTGSNGDFYKCVVAGTANFGAGPIAFVIGDLATYNGSIWQNVPDSNAVNSVNGQTGVVVLDTDDVAEGATNLYFTDTRAKDAVGSSLTNTSDIDLNYTAGDFSADLTATTVTAGSYGSASDTLEATVDAKGRLTALAATPIAISNTQVSGLGTAAVANTGTATGEIPLADDISAVGFSGAYADLTGKPTLGTVAALDSGITVGTIPVLQTGGFVDDARLSTNIARTANVISNTLASANIIVGNGSNVAAAVTPSADVTMNNAGAFTVISSSETQAGKIEIATQGEVNTGTDTVRAVTPSTLTNATIITSKLANTLNSTNIFVGNGSNVAVGVALSQDVTIDNTGAATVISSSETQAGKIEIATQAETNTGSDDARAITPLKLANYTGLTNTAITGKLLSGYSAASGTVSATDSILQGMQKIGASLATTSAQMIVGNSGGVATPTNITGAITVSNTGVTTLSSGIDAAKIADGSVSNAEFQYLDGVTSAIQTQLNAKTSSTLTSAHILVGNGTNIASDVAMSGAVTIDNTGATTLASGIDAAKIADGSVSNTEFQYINGVTSAIQTQIDSKAASSSLATVATSGAYNDLSGKPTLGTAAALNVGTSATNVVQLNGSAQLPAVDGNLLTNLNGGSIINGAYGTWNIGNIVRRHLSGAAPTVNDDSSLGYAAGSDWLDITLDKFYICKDATVGAAVWISIN